MMKTWALIFCCLFGLMGGITASTGVVLIGNSVTMTFDSLKANFTPSVQGSRKCGTLNLAEPIDACSPLTNKIIPRTSNDTKSPFVLITRGTCKFDEKIKRAQDVGFEAAIIYDNQIEDLFLMMGDSIGINITAVCVKKDSGEILSNYAGLVDTELCIVPLITKVSWTWLTWFIVVSACFVVLFVLFFSVYLFQRDFQSRRERTHILQTHIPRVVGEIKFRGMSSSLVKAIPTVIFTCVSQDYGTSRTCAICLEDYSVGERLRILPCRHRFHLVCVDTWLSGCRTFCPVCKHIVQTIPTEPPRSEFTPLQSSVSSLAIQINPSSYGSHSDLQ